MKIGFAKVLTLIAFMLLPIQPSAQAAPSQDLCESMARLIHSIVKARDAGMDEIETEHLASANYKRADTRKAMVDMVDSIYDSPNSSAQEIEAHWLSLCHKSDER